MHAQTRRRRTLLLTITGVVALSAALVAPAAAITSGELDGEDHPFVGLMVAQDAEGAPLWRCSGTLISSTLFLTAGHCTEAPAAHVEIWFQSDVQSGIPGNGYPFTGQVGGTPYGHPDYDPDAFFLHDLGMVVLDEPWVTSDYGELPELNELNALKPSRQTGFTSVGYGRQKSYPDAAAWKVVALRIRMVAHPYLLQINTGFVGDFSILLSNNTATGGTCFGDSGGPNFIGNGHTLAGVTSFGLNRACGGTGGVYRIDKADDLDWIATFFE